MIKMIKMSTEATATKLLKKKKILVNLFELSETPLITATDLSIALSKF